MKKILIISFLCFALVLPQFASAAVFVPGDTSTPIAPTDPSNTSGQATTTTTTTNNSCSTITPANVSDCCTNANTDAQRTACENYYNNPPTTPVAGQINGGVQNTNAQNGGSNSAGAAAVSALTTSANNPATTCSQIKFNTLLDIAIWAKCIIGAVIIPGIFSLAFVVFLWGVFKFIRSSDLKDKQDSKQFIYMGLIGLFVMVSVWGIVRIAATTFGIDATVPMLQTDYLKPPQSK